MIENLLIDNNLSDYGILIGCALILGTSVFYFIRGNNIVNLTNNNAIPSNNNAIPSDNTSIPSNNTEALTNQEIEAINSNLEDLLTDSDFDTESDHANISDNDTVSIADLDEILKDQDLILFFWPYFESQFRNVEFIMPDVDFNVCPIQELKLFEFCSLFEKEMVEHSISEEEMMELICFFSERDLATN
jgi:hypothetical protein